MIVLKKISPFHQSVVTEKEKKNNNLIFKSAFPQVEVSSMCYTKDYKLKDNHERLQMNDTMINKKEMHG